MPVSRGLDEEIDKEEKEELRLAFHDMIDSSFDELVDLVNRDEFVHTMGMVIVTAIFDMLQGNWWSQEETH